MKTSRDITFVVLGRNAEDACLLNELDKLIEFYSSSKEAEGSFYRIFPTLSELRTRLMMESDY